jgi:hypothetical protein
MTSKQTKGIREDVENCLLLDSTHSAYGSTHVSGSSRLSITSLNQQPEEAYSDHGWSSEEFTSINLARRKKKRLQKHHKSNRPKLVSKLSHIVRSRTQSEEEDNTEDVIQMPSDDLILPELDQNAAEVREYVSSSIKSVENRPLRKQKVNLSTIREKYRQARFNERYKKRIKQQHNESFLEMEISHLRKVKK